MVGLRGKCLDHPIAGSQIILIDLTPIIHLFIGFLVAGKATNQAAFNHQPHTGINHR